ncbi:MAG: hypothetical protein H0U44_05890 [Flavisolibacter sp.]|nr:hypothetical protein [Flavisolibacter sp.]
MQNTLKVGTWRVTNFTSNGVDQTPNFQGNIFDFDRIEILKITNGAEMAEGNWNVSNNEETGDDNASEDITLNMNFDNSSFFAILDGSWKVIERTNTKVTFHKAGTVDTDLLTLEQN